MPVSEHRLSHNRLSVNQIPATPKLLQRRQIAREVPDVGAPAEGGGGELGEGSAGGNVLAVICPPAGIDITRACTYTGRR